MSGMKDQLGDTPYEEAMRERQERRVADAGRAARDAALGSVSENNAAWCERLVRYVQSLPAGWIGTGEAIRLQCGLPAPSHPNAWGAAINAVVRRGILVKTGRWVPMTDETSHARSTPEYRRS